MLIGATSAVSFPLPSADKLRVEYILYFTKFVNWPESWLVEELQAINICLDSDIEPKHLMQTSYAGRVSKAHALKVLEYGRGSELYHLPDLQVKSESEVTNRSTILISNRSAEQTSASAIVLTEQEE